MRERGKSTEEKLSSKMKTYLAWHWHKGIRISKDDLS